MIKIEIILPTRGRAHTQLPTFVTSCFGMAAYPDRVNITAVVNAHDEDTLEYMKHHQIIIEDLPKPHLSMLMNMGYRDSKLKNEVVAYIGDDFTFCKDWDTIVEREITRTNGWGLIAGPDGYINMQGMCPTFFFATRKMIDAASDTFVNSHYAKEGTDKFWKDVAGPPLNIFVWCEDLTFEHHHATRTGTYDKTYTELASQPIPGYEGPKYWTDVQECQRRIVRAVKKEKAA